jgi:hypothetical protein
MCQNPPEGVNVLSKGPFTAGPIDFADKGGKDPQASMHPAQRARARAESYWLNGDNDH